MIRFVGTLQNGPLCRDTEKWFILWGHLRVIHFWGTEIWSILWGALKSGPFCGVT